MAITMKVEKITPKIAEEYLTANKQNYRKMSRSQVKKYADDMRSGRWELNGETIVFDENGTLKDGQHRLAAVLMAGMPVEMIVIRGVKEDITAYDLGGNRTALQISRAQDVDLSSEILSAVNLLLCIGKGKTASRMEVVSYAKEHEDELNRAWRGMLNGDNTKYVKRASLILASYMMLKLQKMPFYEVEVFFKAFSTNSSFGTDGYEVSPALVVRRMFIDRWSHGGNQRSQREQLDVLVQAMTDLHENRKRVNNYKISSPFAYEKLIEKLMNEV